MMQRRTIHQIREEKEAKAYLHPVRMRILQFLSGDAMTISQVAAILGVHPANLTHHFRKLQEAALIALVEERDTGRVVEKYYRAVADNFQVRADNVALQGAAQRALHLLQQDMAVAQARMRPDQQDAICLLGNLPLSPKSFARFQKRLEKLMEEFRAEGSGEGKNGENLDFYSLNLSLYPRKPDSGLPEEPESP